LERSGAGSAWKSAVLSAYHRTDFVELERLTSLNPELCDLDMAGIAPAYADAIRKLPFIKGGPEAIGQARELVGPLGCAEGLDDFAETYSLLEETELKGQLLVDFSVMSSFDYYTGIVFEACSPYSGSPIGSGGRYDHMLDAYGTPKAAAGFAFCLEEAMATSQVSVREKTAPPERPLRIAVPKGALNHDAIEALEKAGCPVDGLEHPGRSLIIRNGGVEYIIVRPSDAPVFVALGAADCGICGKDSLLELEADVVELCDLQFGGCRFVVAEPADAAERVEDHYQRLGSIRIATKYPHIAKRHYARTGTQVEIVYLHGNIELAPLTGMAERIVDITATGTTLRENNLVVVEEVLSSTARFFANPCAYRCDGRIAGLAGRLGEVTKNSTYVPIAGQPL
ncbi:MAG: ATP phosphoribosyltransferase, partial [Eggerthellaceae bacterium]|nr:ATP phosphoribosyltransferase [Eggerthellaceae bacterium]